MIKFFHKYWATIFLVVLSGLVVWPFFLPGYFFQHDNLQVIRLFEMRRCFVDLQIPCRWAPDMAYGNGYPLFNFYGVFPYYIGALASYILGFIGATKFLFFLPLVFGGIGMYVLAKEVFGKVAGFVSSVLFLFAPYRAVDVYVRGALGESFGIALIPFVLYFLLKLIKTRKKRYLTWSAIFTFTFFTSHNIMVLLFAPVILAWVIFWLWREGWKSYRIALLALVLSFGLSTFFILPAFLEKDLVQTGTLITGYYDFRNHFVAVFQLFTDRLWGYGGSVTGTGDKLSFQIGWPHWWLVVGAIPLAFLKNKKNRFIVFFLLMVFGASVFMTHNKSSFIWENIKVLSYVQFPWRFLAVVIFASSLLGGFFVSQFTGKLLYIIVVSVVFLTVALNWAYFRPGSFNFSINDAEELSGQAWVNEQAGAVLDYLPKTAAEPRELAPGDPILVDGEGNISGFVRKSNGFSFNVDSQDGITVDVPILDFSGWDVTIDGVGVPHSISKPAGRIQVSVPAGTHRVVGHFNNTLIRTLGNVLTLISAFGLALVLKYGKNRKVFS